MKAIKSSSHRPARRASLKRSHLNGYLAGAAGTAALLGASQSQAAVVYWNPADQTSSPPGQGFRFDMLTGTVTAGTTSTASAFAFRHNGFAEWMSLIATTSYSSGIMAAGTGRLARLTYGTSIGISAPWVSTVSDFEYFNLSGYPWNTNLDGTTGYVGLRFKLSGNTHYGWARFTYNDASSGSLTLHDFAYENVAGQSILAGAGASAVPEPSRALLALAGFGAAGLRRRRKQAA